jgi:hypothetical protein
MTVDQERKQRSRDHLEKWLRAPGREATTPHGFFRTLEHHATGEGWQFDWTAGLEHWWELARIGVIALLGSGAESSYAQAPLFVLTDRGRALLSDGASSPHDADRFLSTLRRRVGTPDAVALSYVEEAIGAWKTGLYRASAVMLGCACERVIIVLAEKLRDIGVSPYSERLTKMLGADKPANISDVFTVVREGLEAAVDDRRLPKEFGQDIIDRRLTPVFERARRLRNRSGHPTGDEVHAEEAEAGLLLFPDFHEFATRICVDLKPKA